MLRWLILALAISGVAGCASVPQPVVVTGLNQARQERFELDGRIAVHYRNDSSTAMIHWQHRPDVDHLVLSSPLGQTLTALTRDEQGVSLIDSAQKTHHAENVESLTEQLLGWKLPLENLSYWIVGNAVPGQAYQMQQDAAHGIAQLTQSGWVVTYSRWQQVDGVNLPNKLTLAGQGVEVRLVIGEWKIVGLE